MKIRFWVCLLLCSLIAVACKDDDESWASYRQELAELRTNANGVATHLYLDNGQRFTINNHLEGLSTDTLYRVQVMYVELENQSVDLYSAKSIISSLPVAADGIPVFDAPVSLKAVWGSPRYFNMLIGLQTGGGVQRLAFIDNGIVTKADGSRKLQLRLYHDQMEDNEYYTQDAYLSCPIYPYENQLVRGRDSIEMVVNTYNGPVSKTLAY